jgi:ABC-type phosphate transport system substrate-binding protein
MAHALRVTAGAAIAGLLLSMSAVGAQARSATLPGDGYNVVVNSANPVTSLHRTELADLFLRRTSRWGDGSTVLPVDGPDSPTRESFSKDVLGKKTAAVRSYWLQVIFSGRGVPPPEKPSDTEVIAYVKAHPEAIGYISAAIAPEGVKLLKVVP